MARRKKRRRSRIWRPFEPLLARIQDFRSAHRAFRNPDRRRILKRNVQKLVAIRTIGPPLLLAIASFVWIWLAGAERLDAGAYGAGLLSAALDGMNFWHRIAGSYLEATDTRIHLYGLVAWSQGLVVLTYLTALYLTWVRAKWIRSTVILGIAPAVYWLGPLATIVGLALFGKRGLLQDWTSTGLILACVLPAILVVYSIDRCFARSRSAARPSRTPAWIDLGCFGVTAIACLAFGYLFLASSLTSPDRIVASYRAAAATSIYQAKLPIARVAIRRLADIADGSNRDQFLGARVSALEGETEKAEQQMRVLAPLPDGGYAMAHLWLAQRLMTGNTRGSQLAKSDALLAHLEFGVERETHDPGIWIDVNEAYYTAKKSLAEFRLERARSHSAAGDVDLAKREGIAARGHYQDMIRETSDSVEFTLQLTECNYVAEDFPTALSVLRRVQQQIPADVFAGTVTRFYVGWYDSLTRRTPDNRTQRLDVLKQGFQHEPDNSQLLNRLLALIAESGIDDLEDAGLPPAARQLDRWPARVHYVLAGQAAKREDLRTARAHYEQANSLKPDQPLILNGLALCLSRLKSPDLDKALELSNRAHELSPKTTAFLETRGQILALKQRWRDAAQDLERALLGRPRSAMSIHLILSEAYEHLGDTKQAAHHKQRAREESARRKRER